jgi:putative nucleotidyltransferase with HDIG domain
MIDIKKAKDFYAEYIKNYDSTNGKIKLKVVHIYHVAEVSKEIATELNLTEEQVDLAELIGLLHDIGRFEQVRRYNTFYDNKSENHAVLGVKVLFDEGLIVNFVEDRKYDEIIKTSILNHNKNRIEEGLDAETKLFCKIIRDADKMDIFRVALTDAIEDVYESNEISNDLISEDIFNQFVVDREINYADRKTYADELVCQLAYVYDFNFNFCLKKIRDNKYFEQMVERIGFKKQDTIDKCNKMLEIANKYMDEKLESKER